MFKRVLIFMAALLVLLSSCSKPAVTKEDIAEKYKGDFKAAAECDFFGEKLVIEVTKKGGNTEFRVLSPKLPEGISAKCGEENKLSYEGMEIDAEIGALPGKSPFSELLRLFESLSAPGSFEIAKSDKEVTVDGEDFSAVLDGETLLPKFAAFDESGDEFVFGEGLFK